MSVAEVLREVRRIRGKFEKVEGIKVYPAFTDHVVKRFTVTESEDEYDLGVQAYVLKLRARDTPVYFNLDRNITPEEYFELVPYQEKLIARLTRKIDARVPQGYGQGTLIVEVLTLA